MRRLSLDPIYKQKSIKYIAYSQLCLLIGAIVAISLKYQGLSANSGFSYYGVYARTIVPYALGMTLSSFFLILAARALPKKMSLDLKIVNFALYLFAFLVVGVMLTPYSISIFVNDIHSNLGITLFSAQLLLVVWMFIKSKISPTNLVLFLLLWVVGIIALLAQITVLKILIEAQIAYQIVFYILFARLLAPLTQIAKKEDGLN